MKASTITGIIIIGVSIGGLVYLYNGFYKPRQEVIKEFEQNNKKQ
jgi:hypothetical protein